MGWVATAGIPKFCADLQQAVDQRFSFGHAIALQFKIVAIREALRPKLRLFAGRSGIARQQGLSHPGLKSARQGPAGRPSLP